MSRSDRYFSLLSVKYVEFCFGPTWCSNLCITEMLGHINCSRGPQVPHPCFKVLRRSCVHADRKIPTQCWWLSHVACIPFLIQRCRSIHPDPYSRTIFSPACLIVIACRCELTQPHNCPQICRTEPGPSSPAVRPQAGGSGCSEGSDQLGTVGQWQRLS